jgi:hypothetical protein
MRALYYAVIFALLKAAPSGAQSSEDAVTLLTNEKALVGAKPMATTDVAAFLVSKAKPNALIMVRNCPGVSADAIQAVVAGIQAKTFIPALASQAPDPRLCQMAR